MEVIKAAPKSRKWEIPQTVQVDGKQTIIAVTYETNEKNGNVSINGKLTTKNLTHDAANKKVVLALLLRMFEEAYDKCLDFHDEFQINKSSSDPAQTRIPYDGEEPEEDEDGGQDDEGEPAGNTLDIAAAPRERRPRRTAHVEN